MMDECWKPGSRCLAFRLSLPWPDSEGSVWVPGLEWPLHCFRLDADGQMVVIRGGRQWSELDRERYEQQFGPGRFAKLLEQNPFGANHD